MDTVYDKIRLELSKNVKISSIIEYKTNKSDSIDVENNNKPETIWLV